MQSGSWGVVMLRIHEWNGNQICISKQIDREEKAKYTSLFSCINATNV